MIIGIVAAMELELQPFFTYLPIKGKEYICRNHFYISQYINHEVALVCCGRGKVNAAVFTHELIQRYQPDLIINCGISGGLAEDSEIFDIYAGTHYCHYDVRRKQSVNTFPKQLYYTGNSQLIRQLLEIEPAVKTGIFGTGEGFVADEEKKQLIIDEFQVSAVDMESAAIAQCCYLNDVDFLSIRSISDKADPKAVLTGESLQKIGAENTAELILKLMKKL